MTDKWQALREWLAECALSIVPPRAPQVDLRGLLAERDALESRIAEALEFCEDREDIVDGEHGPLPNDFMQVATILKGRVA